MPIHYTHTTSHTTSHLHLCPIGAYARRVREQLTSSDPFVIVESSQPVAVFQFSGMSGCEPDATFVAPLYFPAVATLQRFVFFAYAGRLTIVIAKDQISDAQLVWRYVGSSNTAVSSCSGYEQRNDTSGRAYCRLYITVPSSGHLVVETYRDIQLGQVSDSGANGATGSVAFVRCCRSY